ncbi:MAG TPA: 2-oxoacid:acceptor oxidoreductase subunit alpha [Methanoregulaceae archaeon]|nr:2-oxoacid:acceptor oxidoreductase subunit alpha [Methanoregulaceae archaeon]HQJ87275.1 2-oxoacid:acceptor oxidoreductase subunit alpha [Methanoregulaceae archaeon]
MEEFSVLIGGRAGEGINRASAVLNRLMARLGRYVYMYYDYPSLIRGGHNFAIVRSADRPIGTHRERVDAVIALDRETVRQHASRLSPGGVLLFDSSVVRESVGVPVPLDEALDAEGAPPITRNSGMIGAFCRAAGIPWSLVETVFEREFGRHAGINLRVARRSFEMVEERIRIPRIDRRPLPVLTGNEAIALGLVRGGLDTYIAYPMTPTSSILHLLAGFASRTALSVVHPESEIAVILMALGGAYAGSRCAVGTSGGGFCLMTEGLSLSGMAEVPVVIVLGQRPGPSTGLPTYSCQTELLFARHAGQGEFPRLIAAPADASEAYVWSARALELAWRFQVPAILLADKTLCEGGYSAVIDPDLRVAAPDDRNAMMPGEPYLRYRITPDGVSPLRTVPSAGDVIKVNSYEHDESGTTTEDAEISAAMQRKRREKARTLGEALRAYETVDVSGPDTARVGVVTWGSTAGAVREAVDEQPLRLVRPIVLEPFPTEAFRAAVDGLERLIVVEQNWTGQLEQLMRLHGFGADGRVHRFDGRPFTVEEIVSRLAEVV